MRRVASHKRVHPFVWSPVLIRSEQVAGQVWELQVAAGEATALATLTLTGCSQSLCAQAWLDALFEIGCPSQIGHSPQHFRTLEQVKASAATRENRIDLNDTSTSDSTRIARGAIELDSSKLEQDSSRTRDNKRVKCRVPLRDEQSPTGSGGHAVVRPRVISILIMDTPLESDAHTQRKLTLQTQTPTLAA